MLAESWTGPGYSGVEMLTLNISEGSSTSTPELPITSVQRPCYLADLTQVEPDATNSISLDMTVTDDFTTDVYSISWNSKSETMTSKTMEQLNVDMLHYPAMAEMQVGTVQELKLTGAGEHPVHIHVNHMQITEMTSDASENGYFQVGDHHDTLLLPGVGMFGSVKVRMQLYYFVGKMVVHCHVLTHEDEGMMAYVNISGRKGTIYESDKLDPTCYRGRFSSTASQGHSSEVRSSKGSEGSDQGEAGAGASKVGSSNGGRKLQNVGQTVSHGWVLAFVGLGTVGMRLRRRVDQAWQDSGIECEAESPC